MFLLFHQSYSSLYCLCSTHWGTYYKCVGYSVTVFSLFNLASLVPIVAEIVPPYSQRDLDLSILEHFKVQFKKKQISKKATFK